jgi:peptide methionine sulfoxide reductase MsrA
VGYAGGMKKNPTYRSLGDHTETVQIDFDPSVIPYGELLAVFWESHEPGSSTWSRQYMNAVF